MGDFQPAFYNNDLNDNDDEEFYFPPPQNLNPATGRKVEDEEKDRKEKRKNNLDSDEEIEEESFDGDDVEEDTLFDRILNVAREKRRQKKEKMEKDCTEKFANVDRKLRNRVYFANKCLDAATKDEWMFHVCHSKYVTRKQHAEEGPGTEIEEMATERFAALVKELYGDEFDVLRRVQNTEKTNAIELRFIVKWTDDPRRKTSKERKEAKAED